MRVCHLTALAVGIMSVGQAMAAPQSDSQGFIEDSHLDLLLRNAYISRDYKRGAPDRAEWGQSVTAHFTSGFTQGTVGLGVDALALYGLRLDGGRGKSGAGGIDFFKRGDSGTAADQLTSAGAAVKARISRTQIKYGDQVVQLPIMQSYHSRLLPDVYTGTLLTSREVDGLELNIGRFTAQNRKSASGSNSGHLKRIDVYGASYRFNDTLSGSLYALENEDTFNRQYVNLSHVARLGEDQSLTTDFNGYKSRMNRAVAAADARDNKIWSLAFTWTQGIHSLTLAHQRSTGETGFHYGGYRNTGGYSDGSDNLNLANSYWSDYNAKDERSWQVGYGVDLGQAVTPGLSFRSAVVRGDNIDDGTGRGRGEEREFFNQLSYVVQGGAAKDLSLRVRSSHLKVSRNASAYMSGGNELRVFVDYPLSVF
jgi:hypothetical protein